MADTDGDGHDSVSTAAVDTFSARVDSIVEESRSRARADTRDDLNSLVRTLTAAGPGGLVAAVSATVTPAVVREVSAAVTRDIQAVIHDAISPLLQEMVNLKREFAAMEAR